VSASAGRIAVERDGRVIAYKTVLSDGRVHLSSDGRAASYRVAPRVDWLDVGEAGDGDGGGRRVVATLPGLVSAVAVEAGQVVTKGETVVVLEAMKLLHALPAPAAGRVAAVLCAAGQTVAAGAALVEIEPEAEADTADGVAERSVPS
jgi:biotin carboxyl carrier protein